MKRKLIYVFIGICVLLLGLYFFRYKQSQTFTDRVPKDATAIINVNIRQLEHHILLDLLKHPMPYFRSDTIPKDTVEKQKFSLTKGVDIPKNILFFTNDDTFKNTWYSSVFKVNDTEEFSQYLVTEKFKKKGKTFRKGNLVFTLKDRQLIIAILYDKTAEISETVQAIFNETDYLPGGSSLLKLIEESSSDICLATTSHDFFEANFKDDVFEIQGKVNPNFDLFIASLQPQYNQNTIAFFTGKINKKHALFKTISQQINASKFNATTHLAIDSIFKAWNGKLSFNLKAIESKTDTIITYEYDGDFNKIEKVTTQKIASPKLMLQLENKKNRSLLDYFTTKNAIQIIEKDTLFTAIPLYTFHVTSQEGNLKIYTSRGANKEFSKKINSKLSGYLNMDSYWQSPQQFSFLPIEYPFFTMMKDASIQISENNEFLLQINLKNKNRNFLGQYVRPSSGL